MEDVQHQQSAVRPSFPPTSKWPPDSTETLSGEGTPKYAHDGGSFGQDSGYNSYQATTSYNTFNMASMTYATIDEGNENDCSLNDSCSGPSAISLTPRTAASMDLLSKIHLTTPKTADRSKPTRLRPIAFDFDGTGGTSVDSLSFLAPSTPERLPGASRALNAGTQDTPRRTGNRSANQPIQLTPHKAKGGTHSLKRKHSSFRGKLYSDGALQLGDENRSDNLNDSFEVDCRRLEDISPILNTKRRKHHDRGIEDLMRSSTPKTASSQPTFLSLHAVENRPAAKQNLRKIQSFSPSKIKSYTRPLLRHNPVRALERTPEKNKEHRVLTEIDLESSENTAIPPRNFGALLGAPILDDPVKQLEQTVTTVPSSVDFSLTPSKANLIDPELMQRSGAGESFVAEDFVVRHAPNYSYAPTLNSILEESPVRSQIISAKQPVPKTPPSVSKSGRKLKRLGTNGTVLSASCTASPARYVRSLSRQSVRASQSPQVRRLHVAQNQSLKTLKTYNYCGFEYVNILHQLNKRNRDALGVLLEYLADTDLVQVVRVSRGWRSIIENHPGSWKRLQRYLKQQEQNKENARKRQEIGQLPPKITEQIEQKETIVGDSNVPERKPFQLLSSGSCGNVSGSQLSRSCSFNATNKSAIVNVTLSPPVSPSMRKFTINQKIASQLKPKEQLRPCPRCEHPSRIIFSRTSQSGSKRTNSSDYVQSSTETANLSGVVRNNNEYSEKSPAHVRKNLFNNSTPSAAVTSFNHSSEQSFLDRPEEQRMKLRSNFAAAKSVSYPSASSAIIEDRLIVRDPMCDYAICSGKLCGFKFCIKCLGAHHPNAACADLFPNSPTKVEDLGQPNVACTRQSRRSLLRLCKK
uniref:F-box domain-containing protein n=1 Tax=Anopheles minimus TaxID=112268 RepID=A0A182WF91_9DIPT